MVSIKILQIRCSRTGSFRDFSFASIDGTTGRYIYKPERKQGIPIIGEKGFRRRLSSSRPSFVMLESLNDCSRAEDFEILPMTQVWVGCHSAIFPLAVLEANLLTSSTFCLGEILWPSIGRKRFIHRTFWFSAWEHQFDALHVISNREEQG